MIYIIPQNYNFRNKLLGIIDYPTAIFNVVLIVVFYLILKILTISLLSKIVIFIVLYLPFLLLTLFGFYNESFLFVLIYVIKYLLSPKVYLYK
jgi:hypothetical protein